VEQFLAAELGDSLGEVETLGTPGPRRLTWAAESAQLGRVVVKARYGDRADEKTRWCAANLPRLGARGYPVPEILWHGPLASQWCLVVESRLPGAPLEAIDPLLLDALVELVELQADAGLPWDERDFATYQSYVLFDGWDHVWRDAEASAPELCARIRAWLRPVRSRRLPPVDFAHNDLNLSNVLERDGSITGVVDWDEFGLNSRATDLVALAFDCELLGERAGADRLLAKIDEVVAEDGLRLLVSYRVISHVAARARRRDEGGAQESARAAASMLDHLDG
jgi:aminoglycoside phosphotransferase